MISFHFGDFFRLLSSGRLDEAREECDAGLAEAVGSKESIVRIALGSIRAQVRGW